MKVHHFPFEPRMFRYHRINPSLSERGLREIECGHMKGRESSSGGFSQRCS